MRNCFVPFCDTKNKNIKRMMFQPPKEESLFEAWKKVLPKKREFKKIDKVCEQHFDPVEIERTWEHTINGKKVLMERAKPRLKKCAIPKHNLPGDDEIWKKKTDLLPKPRKVREKKIKEIPMEIADENQVPKEPSTVSENNDIIKSQLPITHSHAGLSEDEILERFEALYDDIFEVVLPSTLWGIHRDPEKQYIVFSEFNHQCMGTLKMVFIDNKFKCQFLLKSRFIKNIIVENCDSEGVSKVLSEIDDYKVCSKLLETTNSSCKGLIENGGQTYCDSCLNV